MPSRVSLEHQVVDQLVVQRFEPASRVVVQLDWMCSASISGFGLKNSFRIGCSSLRIQRDEAAAATRRASCPRTRSCGASSTRRAPLPELLEQIRADAARIEELLELDVGELADLVLGVVDAALLADPRADLPHDLLDVDGVGSGR